MKHYFSPSVSKSVFAAIALLIGLQLFSQPVNDDCTNAISITPSTSCSFTTYTNAAATYSTNTPLPSCASYTASAQDVWFKVIVPAGGALIFDTQAGVITDGGMAIYYGTCGALTLIECDDDDGAGAMPMISRTGLTPGAVVYIRFWEYGGGTQGTFGLCVYAPPSAPPCVSNPAAGDNCSAPTPICNLNGYCGNTSSSYTVDSPGNLSSNFCGSIDNNSWLSFVADSTAAVLNIFVSNCSYNYGIQMEIYSVNSCNTFVPVSNCWNPGVMQNGTIIATGLTVGQTYYLMVDGYAGDVCNYVISAQSGVFTADAGNDVSICAGQSTTLNASGGTTYSWSPTTGLSNPNIANPVATPATTTTYTLTATGGNPLCPGSYTDQVTVTVVNLTPVASNNGSICAGQTLNLSVTPNGASGYSWSGPNGFTSTLQNPSISNATPLASGTYTVTVTSGSCSVTATTNVTVNNAATVSATATPASICSGSSTSITATGANSYSWSSGGTGSTINVSPTSTTSYTVTGTTTLGCTGTATVSIIVNSSPVVGVSATNNSVCSGSSTTLTATGANTYSWSSGGTGSSVSITPASSGTYTVTGTSAAGCTSTASISITVNPLPDVAANASPSTICSGSPATLNASGASTYSWSTGATGSSTSVSPTSTTTYTVTGTSPLGCTATASATVTVNSLPTVNASATPATVCAGSSVILSASGANTYAWSSGGSGSFVSVNPTTTTTYTVTGTSSAGCSRTTTVTVNVNPAPNISISALPSSVCVGSGTTLTASGASTYSWSSGGSGSSVSVSPSSNTTYTVTGTSASGCTSTSNILITVNPLPIVSISPSSASICAGSNANLNASGASTYSWSNGGSGSTIAVSPSSNTTYTVTGTSAAGCTATSSVNISVNALPVIGASAASSTICVGSSTLLSATGGNTYAWSNGSSGSPISVNPITSTTYLVTGTSAAGCSSTASVLVTVSSNLTISATSTPATICFGQNASLSATGGTFYSWNTGATSNPVSVAPSATTTYSVTGTDAIGCSGSTTVTITVNPLPSVVVTALPASLCAGQNTTLSASGANSYLWNTGSSSTSFNIMPTGSGTYSVTGTSSNGCSASTSVYVTVTPLPVVTISATPPTICAGASTNLQASGATTYLWNTGGNSQSISISPASTTSYSVTGTSGSGCSSTGTITVVVNPLPTVTLNATPNPVCSGQNVALSATGANSYSWSTGASGSTTSLSPTETATYSVTGTTSLGCSNVGSITITVNELPEIDFSGYPLSGCMPLAVAFNNLSVGSGNSWQWNFGDGSSSTASAPNHIYSHAGYFDVALTGTSAQGCSKTITYPAMVQVFQKPNASISASPEYTTTSNPAIEFSGSTMGIDSWLWDFGNGDYSTQPPSVSYSYNSDGTFTVSLIVSTADGCSDTAYTNVEIAPEPAFYNIITPGGDGHNDIFIIQNAERINNKLSVTNRWGKKVFEAVNYQNDWDGGNLDDGTYYIIFLYGRDLEFQHEGTLTIIREK